MRWNILPEPPQSFYDEHPELVPIVARMLYHRGIRTQEQIDQFLAPEYSKDVFDPFLFRDMNKTVTRLFQAIENNERIVIHGDYDADGVSASVILTDTLTALGATNLDVYLPHRETDGYGLNTRTISLLAEQGTKVIITCDCGISNKTEVDLANELGIDVIVTDHHTIPAELPNAYAIIHPKIEGETYPDKHLAGGGVAFKLAQALLRTNKESHELLSNGETHEGFEKWLLDMVAIASVADMVPLIGESRTLTKYGLLVLNKTRRIGLQKLLLEARLMHDDGTLAKEIDANVIGFGIAPRINAAGRLDYANVAYKLLVEHEPTRAIDLAFQLDQNNNERREVMDRYIEQAVDQIETYQKDSPVLFVYNKEWATGIVGLVASRLKDKYHKPVIAMGTKQEDITGSGRSVEGFNLIEALQSMPHHFKAFGGHPMACGFNLVTPEQKEAFQQELTAYFMNHTKDLDMSASLTIDADIALEDVTWELFDALETCKPFGQHNHKPLFAAYGVQVVKVETMGKQNNHLRLYVKHKGHSVKKLIGWGLCGDLASPDWTKVLKPGEKIDIVFDVDVNEWNGNRELQMTMKDIKKSA